MEIVFKRASVFAFYLSHPASLTKRSDKEHTEHVAIGVRKGGIAIIGTGLVGSFERIVPSEEVDVLQEGAFTVDAKRIVGIVKTFGDKPLKLVLRKDEKSTRLLVSCGRSKITVREVGEASKYPQPSTVMGEREVFNVDIAKFQRGLKMCLTTMPTQDAKAYLNGINVTIKDRQMTFVSTDTHKLTVFKQAIDGITPLEQDISFTIPCESVQTLLSMHVETNTALLEVSRQAMALTVSSLRYQSKLYSDQYPDIAPVLPTETRGGAVVAKSELAAVISRGSEAFEKRSSDGKKQIPRIELSFNTDNTITTALGKENAPVATDEVEVFQAQIPVSASTAMNYRSLTRCASSIHTEQVSLVLGVMKQRQASAPEQLTLLLSPTQQLTGENYFIMMIPMR